MEPQLTSDAIAKIAGMGSSDEDASFQPMLQMLNVRKVSSAGGQDRFRVVLSDGQKYIQGLLTSQTNQLVYDGTLKTNSVFRLTKFVKNVVSGRSLVVVLNLDVIGENPERRLGEPTDIQGQEGGGGLENMPPQQQNAAAQGMYGHSSDNNSKPVKPEGGGNSYGGGNNSYGSSNNNPYGGGGSRGNPYGGGSSSNAPIVRTTPGGTNYTLISNLNMYQSRWTIRARITSKSDVRTWSNARGEGSLFSVELLDSSGVDIKATFFKEGVDKFFNVLQEGKVYTFTGGRIKVANMTYNTCKSNFELNFDANAEVHLDNDGGDISRNIYEFVPIAQLENTPEKAMVDVLAIVKNVGDQTSITSKKTGQELVKCELALVDDSGAEISMTIWGADKAAKVKQDFADKPVVAFRRARVGEFNGKNLSLNGSYCIRPVEDIPNDVHRLEQWWNNGGSTGAGTKSLSGRGGGGTVASFADRQDIAAIKGKHMGHGEKPDWITFKGSINFIKKDKEGGAWYPACANANDPCKNMYKVTQTTDGNWFCDKCQGTFDQPVRRWIFSATIEDDTASTWVSFFNPQAETLLDGKTADEAFHQYMEENQDQDGYDSLFFKALNSEWIFKCKVKSEIVNEEQRVKTQVTAMQPVDYVKECQDMLEALQKWS